MRIGTLGTILGAVLQYYIVPTAIFKVIKNTITPKAVNFLQRMAWVKSASKIFEEFMAHFYGCLQSISLWPKEKSIIQKNQCKYS